MNNKGKIAITLGDPAGIGYEITLKALDRLRLNPQSYVLIGNKDILQKTAELYKISINNEVQFENISGNTKNIFAGSQSVESGRISYESLLKACRMANDGEISGIVTAPLSKEAINSAGFHFSGQTEVIEQFCGKGKKAEMLFVTRDFKVLLLTRHMSIDSVCKNLTTERISESMISLISALRTDFGIANPRIGVCGINPHAGENGLLGQEEKEILIPTLNKLKLELGADIQGPFPADTIWVEGAKAYMAQQPMPYDAYVACYHDQGLIPIKLLGMNTTVNMTINLPVLRTSPAHGTAFNIAGKNIANCESMVSAIISMQDSLRTKSVIQHNNTKFLQI